MCLLTRADTPYATHEPDKCWFIQQSTIGASMENPSLFVSSSSIFWLVFNTNLCFPQIITMDLHDPQ